jgi:beta-lactamase regulating signal transducer with metallopeptidase domain
MIPLHVTSAQFIFAKVVSELPDAALRSLALAIGVWVVLHLFRVRNVLALKCAWTLVLAAAFMMPLLLPIASHLPRATLVLPAFMHRAAQATSAPPSFVPPEPIAAAETSQPTASPAPQKSAAPATAQPGDPAPPAAMPSNYSIFPASEAPAPQAPALPTLSIFAAVALLYFAISGLLLLRLVYGLVSAGLIWRAAQPVSAELTAAHGLRLRASAAVSSPVTIGSSVVLPADYMDWDSEKLRIVLAHERSHIRQGDFYLQALAGLYAAIVWFSPLGWWLKRQLSDLAEAISDRSGLEQAASRASYARILLEFAAAPHLTEIGVAMARSSNLSHRIERLFNEGAFRQAFTASRRTLATALLVPVVLFAATTLVRVEAQAQAQQAASTPSQASATSQSPSQPATPSDAAPAAPEAAPTLPQPPAPGSAATPAIPAAPASPAHVEIPPVHVVVPAVHVNVPAVHVAVPAVHVNVPAQHIEVPAVHVDVPAKHFDVPAVHVDVPAHHIDIPAKVIDIPAKQIDIPAKHIDIPATHFDVPSSDAPSGSDGRASNGPGGELLAVLDHFGHALFSSAAPEPAETTFDRTLSFSGKLDLSVSTGAGSITFTRGAASQIHIHGIVKVIHGGDPAQAQQVAANPPIEQQGNTIRIGGHQENLHNISISYEIEAPADTQLSAATGSGNITDTGVGQDAKLTTGSGNIMATGIDGGFKIQTGSGNIAIDSTGQGDAKAQTGSGTIDLKGVHGSLVAQTGSGGIKAAGTPSSPWKLQSGSGSIELSTGNAPMDLDATVGSGLMLIHFAKVTQTAAMPGVLDRHHVHTQLNGGGPEVRIQTGSGDIRVD